MIHIIDPRHDTPMDSSATGESAAARDYARAFSCNYLTEAATRSATLVAIRQDGGRYSVMVARYDFRPVAPVTLKRLEQMIAFALRQDKDK